MKILTNGVNLNVRQVGAGPDLILIHGLAANHAFWSIKVLLPLAHRFRVTVYDLRGHGYSDMPPTGYRTIDMAADLLGLMDAMGVREAHLVGHSFGGLTALQFAALHPGRVLTLALADARVRALQPAQRIQDWPDSQWAQEILQEYGLKIPEDEENVGLWLLDQIASPEWRETRMRIGKKAFFVPFGGHNGNSKSAGRWRRLVESTTAMSDVRDPSGLTLENVRGVEHPTLLIYGERSRCMKSCHGLQRELPDSRTVIVPEAGHFFPVSRPDFLVETLLRFHAETTADRPAPVGATDR